MILFIRFKEKSLPSALPFAGPVDLKTVGLIRRGPPTCRHRREWLRHEGENFRRSRIPSHLTLRAKVGRPRRVSPTRCGSARAPYKVTFHILSGRVSPPGEPVDVKRTVESKGTFRLFLGCTFQFFRLRSRRERPTFFRS